MKDKNQKKKKYLVRYSFFVLLIILVCSVTLIVSKQNTNVTKFSLNAKKIINRAATESVIDTTSIELSKEIGTVTVAKKQGEWIALTAKILPENANNNTNITWSSSDTSIADIQVIDNTGIFIIGKGSGTATITARTENGVTAKCKIKVLAELKWSVGDGVTAEYNQNERTLTISGSGGISTYTHNQGGEAPFENIDVDKIVIESGITSIGAFSFANCMASSIEIPDTVKTIGHSAFLNCIALESIKIPNSVTSILESAFSGCINLKKIIVSKEIVDNNQDAFKGYESAIQYSDNEQKPNNGEEKEPNNGEEKNPSTDTDKKTTNNSNTNSIDKANKIIPNAGYNPIIAILISIFAIVVIVSLIKYRKLKY